MSSMLLFLHLHSARCLAEMGKKNARWIAVEEDSNVTREASQNRRPAVILDPVLSGKLGPGAR